MRLNDKLQQALQEAVQIKNATKQKIAVASVIAEALRSVGQDPILVGGAAVEFYTQGEYSTADIDMVTFGGPKVVQMMSELGFERKGKDFVHPTLDLYVEFPGESLGPTQKYDIVQLDQRSLKVISTEDLIIDRLCSYKFWKSAIDGLNAMMLLEQADIDTGRLLDRAKEEDVEDALQAVKEIRELVIRQRLPKKQSSALLEKAMRELNV